MHFHSTNVKTWLRACHVTNTGYIGKECGWNTYQQYLASSKQRELANARDVAIKTTLYQIQISKMNFVVQKMMITWTKYLRDNHASAQ